MMRLVTTIVAAWLLVLPVGAADFEIPFKIYGKRHAILVQVAVNGKSCTFLLDTGAARTVILKGISKSASPLKVVRSYDEVGHHNRCRVVAGSTRGRGRL